jgi:hypothetical protein
MRMQIAGLTKVGSGHGRIMLSFFMRVFLCLRYCSKASFMNADLSECLRTSSYILSSSYRSLKLTFILGTLLLLSNYFVIFICRYFQLIPKILDIIIKYITYMIKNGHLILGAIYPLHLYSIY